MQCAWDDCVGIGVDVHVHRISGRLGWTTNAKVPEDTRLVIWEGIIFIVFILFISPFVCPAIAKFVSQGRLGRAEPVANWFRTIAMFALTSKMRGLSFERFWV